MGLLSEYAGRAQGAGAEGNRPGPSVRDAPSQPDMTCAEHEVPPAEVAPRTVLRDQPGAPARVTVHEPVRPARPHPTRPHRYGRHPVTASVRELKHLCQGGVRTNMLSRRAGTATLRRVSGSVHDSSAVRTWGPPGRGLSRMQIGELSKRTGPNPRSLRYYENQGPLSSSHSGAGQRPLPPSPPSRPVTPRARSSSRWHEKCPAAQRHRPSVADRRRSSGARGGVLWRVRPLPLGVGVKPDICTSGRVRRSRHPGERATWCVSGSSGRPLVQVCPGLAGNRHRLTVSSCLHRTPKPLNDRLRTLLFAQKVEAGSIGRCIAAVQNVGIPLPECGGRESCAGHACDGLQIGLAERTKARSSGRRPPAPAGGGTVLDARRLDHEIPPQSPRLRTAPTELRSPPT
ncbi:MerR family transcriptional regulator [Streptomyces sp. NPDC054854]